MKTTNQRQAIRKVLRLNKETLRALERGELAGVQGGADTDDCPVLNGATTSRPPCTY